MSNGKVPYDRTGSLSIYPGPYVRWKGPRVKYGGPMYTSRALCLVGRSKSIVVASIVYNCIVMGSYV